MTTTASAPDLGGVSRERHRVRGGLRAAVDGDLEPSVRRLQEEIGDATPLLDAEQDPLPRRSQREDPVEARVDEEVAERTERVVVERAAVLPQRRDRRGERTPQHGRTLSSAQMASLRIERDGHVLRVTLAKPERRNAFDAALIAELTEAFADVGDARAVLLEGEGPSFCAGADVEWQRASIDLSYDENVADAMRLYRMLEAIDVMPGAGGLLRARLRARRRLWPRRLRRRRGRVARRGVRLHGGPARDHPGCDLAVRPRRRSARRRGATSSPASASTRTPRCGSASCQEVSEDAGERAESIVRDILAGGPIAVREAKRLVRERPMATRPRASPQPGERATKDRTGSARSSSAAPPAGSRRARPDVRRGTSSARETGG